MNQIELLNEVQSLTDDAGAEPLCSELHHANARLHPCDLAVYQRITYFNTTPLGHELVRRAAKLYACAERVPLPAAPPLEVSLSDAICRRESARQFTHGPISLNELSAILRYGNGLNDTITAGKRHRAIPSGGALYPTELYVLPMDVPELSDGTFHYDAYSHQLERFSAEPAEPALRRACQTDVAIGTVSAALVITACFSRQAIKYGERAYRFTLMECGHLAQNLLLVATALGIGALPLGGFLDDPLNRCLGIDGTDEAALYVVLIG